VGRTGVTIETLSGTEATGAPVFVFVTLIVVVVVPGGSVAGPTMAVSMTPVGGIVPLGGVTVTMDGFVDVAVNGPLGGGATGLVANVVTVFFPPGAGKLSDPGMKISRMT